MAVALAVKDLHKRYRSRTALNGLSFEIPDRSIAAFVGANGAGKSTTFALIGGYFKPNGGSIEICGKPLAEFKKSGGMLGILPQDVLFYESRTVFRQLWLFAQLAGLSDAASAYEVGRVLELVQLSDRRNELVSQLSHGMKVRLGVAQALVGNPPLILLDEPTSGLDPKMLSTLRSVILSLKGSTTIVISSHDLSELEQMCDHLCIIDQGRLIKQGPLSDLLAKSSKVSFGLTNETLELSELQAAFPDFKCERASKRVIQVQFDPAKIKVEEVNKQVLSWLISKGAGILEVSSQRSLEEMFLEETSQ
ncbi:MAG: hypothetical protein DCC75_00595 [Proteobacteria bacterium]|nr:MAG: hypothetical protein DCC75_00595 [Pseudomonadota bacterium]